MLDPYCAGASLAACGAAALGGDRVADRVSARGRLAWRLDGRVAVIRIGSLFGALLERRHDDVHAATLEQRLPLDRPVLREELGRAHQQVASEVGVADLAPAEADGDLDAIPVLEELSSSSRLHLEIVDVDLDAQPDLLEGLRLLLLLLFALPLLELVLVLPVVEDAAHRRDGRWRHFDEVQPLLLGQRERLEGRHHAELLPLIVDDPNLADPDHLVDAEIPCQCLPLQQQGHLPITDGWPCERARIAAG